MALNRYLDSENRVVDWPGVNHVKIQGLRENFKN